MLFIINTCHFYFQDRCQRHSVLPIAYLNMNLPRIDGTATLMTLAQLKEMFFAVCPFREVFLIINISLVRSSSTSSSYPITES